jgi:hypothetical protein
LCTAASLVLASACSQILPLTAIPLALNGAASLSAGEWSGTTSQGEPITFTVSPDELLTTITIGYNFKECSGSHTSSDLVIRTAPELVCIPGPCPGRSSSYRAFGYMDGSVGGGPVTQVNGIFLPGNQAKGQASFVDYPECGTASAVEWTATRR